MRVLQLEEPFFTGLLFQFVEAKRTFVFLKKSLRTKKWF